MNSLLTLSGVTQVATHRRQFWTVIKGNCFSFRSFSPVFVAGVSCLFFGVVMSVFYQTVTRVLPVYRRGFYAVYDINQLATDVPPVDSVVKDCDAYILQRTFNTREQAKLFGNYLCCRYSQFSLMPPTLKNLQLELEMEVPYITEIRSPSVL